MRLALAFVPRSSPSYMPLGIASLAPVIRAHAPQAELALHDLNIDAWHWMADQQPEWRDAAAILRGQQPGFHDATRYPTQASALAAMARRFDHLSAQARRYVEQDILPESLEALLRRQTDQLLQSRPERIGLSLMYPEQLHFGLALALYLRRHGGPSMLLGGALLGAIDGEALLRTCDFVDALVLGEGEPAAVKWARGAAWSDMPGCLYRDDDSIRPSPRRRQPVALDLCPVPDFEDLLPTRYFNPEPVIPILGSRGCLWRRCRFCAHNVSFGKYRVRDAAVLVDQVQHYQERHGATCFYLADQYVDAAALDAFATELLRRQVRCAFHIMGRMTADYTRELLFKAAAAGCVWISWGTESGSQRLLDLVNKGVELAEMERILRDAHEAGISNLAMMIYGLPTTTREDLQATFGFLSRCYPYLQAMTASSFVLFSTTPFGHNPERYDLEVLDRQLVLQRHGHAVRSTRVTFRRKGETQDGESPLGNQEVELWKRYRAWLGDPTIMDNIACEHYLIYAARERSIIRPDFSGDPLAPLPHAV